VKVMVGDNVLELSDKLSIKTPLGVYDGYVLDMMSSSSAGVIAAEVDGGVLIIKGGTVDDIAIRGYIDILVLDSVQVAYLEAKVGQMIFMGSAVERAQVQVSDVLEISRSSVANIDIVAEHLKHFHVRHSDIANLILKTDKIDSLILYGTRKKPININGGKWEIGAVDTMWVSGNQLWDKGFRLEIDHYRHFLGESLKYVELKDAYVPRWLEMLIAYRDVEREFSELL